MKNMPISRFIYLHGNKHTLGCRYKTTQHRKSMVSCQKGPTRHAYAWQIGSFWQDTLEISMRTPPLWLRQNIYKRLNSQKPHHISPSRTKYWVYYEDLGNGTTLHESCLSSAICLWGELLLTFFFKMRIPTVLSLASSWAWSWQNDRYNQNVDKEIKV